jgi:N-methylhydantoinase A
VGKLINIDNGGTLTDICVLDGSKVWRTKTLTTPFDLSRCFIDGLTKASKAIYGQDDLVALLASTDHIRYSTTQGTNALVERKGQRLGLLLTGSLSRESLRNAEHAADLLDALVGGRCVTLDLSQDAEALEMAAVRAINTLASSGAHRVVVAHGGADRLTQETRLKKIFLRKFPQHLLGAVPLLYSHEVVQDEDDVRRTWTALFNAFLHPAMERFLYNAEHKLRLAKTRNPLLIFRNDGHSARVAKTIALKTYSSGPRGGMEGSRALAQHYGFEHLVSIDIGGTTTDIGEVSNGSVREERRGRVENVEVSFPLCNVVSVGVGGSSIIQCRDGKHIEVGPQSVGSAPGPAAFGLGGTQATITDAFVLTGLLDPATFFGGDLRLDVERARAAIAQNVAQPLGVTEEVAAERMEAAWIDKVAQSIHAFTRVTPQTTLAAFGGAGPFVVCRIAEAAGIDRVLIPGLAAVFSAFGLGFSDIEHRYEAPLASANDLPATLDELTRRARRGMHAEGFALEDCVVERRLAISGADRDEELPLSETLPQTEPGERLSVALNVRKPISQPALQGRFGSATHAAVEAGQRGVVLAGKRRELPLYRLEDQQPGTRAAGPAVLEEAFFTCRLDAGWQFEFNDAGDVLLSRSGRA